MVIDIKLCLARQVDLGLGRPSALAKFQMVKTRANN
jgi:hypothetical protein